MENDLISRSALLDFAHNHVGGTVDCNDIARFPAEDAEPVRHGRCKDGCGGRMMLLWKKHKNIAALIPEFSVGVKLEDYLLGLLDSQPVRIHNGIDSIVSPRAEYVREALRNSLVSSRFDWRKMTVTKVRLEDGVLNVWVRKEREETNGK